MTPDNDTHPHDDLAIYALDALDPDEHAAIEAHLAGCAACRAELETHRDTLSRLIAPDEEPPPSVWEGIAQQLPRLGGAPDAPVAPDLGPLPGATPTASEPAPPRGGFGAQGLPFDLPPAADRPAGAGATADPGDGGAVVPLHARRTRRARHARPGGGSGFAERSGWFAAAAALVAVVGVGSFVAGRSGGDRGDGGGDTVTDLAAAAAESSGSDIVALRNDGGDEVARVVLTGEATDYVIFDDLAELPSDRSYQLWSTDPAGAAPPVSLGVLGGGDTAAVAIAAPEGVTDLALTDEPAGGVPAPTGAVVASGTRV